MNTLTTARGVVSDRFNIADNGVWIMDLDCSDIGFFITHRVAEGGYHEIYSNESGEWSHTGYSATGEDISLGRLDTVVA